MSGSDRHSHFVARILEKGLESKMEQTNKIDELLEKTCYVIDVFPEQVKPDAGGQYFDIEYYLLNSEKYFSLKDRFVNVILKLMCYHHVSIQWKGWIDRPSPQAVEKAINMIMENHSGWLNVLLPEKNTLVVFEWDCLNLSVYNSPEEVQSIMQKIAASEGLFWRKSEVNEM